MISGLMSKIAAVLAAVVAILAVILKFQSKKIEDLEDENATLEKKNELKTQAAIDKAQVLADEQEEILKAVKDDKKISLDDINNL